MKLTKLSMIFLMSIMLGGCADSSNRGDSMEKEYAAPISIHDNVGDVSVTYNVYATSDAETATKQDISNNATVAPKTSASMAEAGSTAASSLGDAVSAGIEGVTNTFNPDMSKTTTEVIKPTVPVLPGVGVPTVLPGDETPDNETTWKHIKIYNMQEISHGRPLFRFKIPGSQFGSSVLFTDHKGNTFFVPDTSKDTGDMAQQYFFNGKDKEKTFDGNASLFWYVTGSHSITAHFNGVE